MLRDRGQEFPAWRRRVYLRRLCSGRGRCRRPAFGTFLPVRKQNSPERSLPRLPIVVSCSYFDFLELLFQVVFVSDGTVYRPIQSIVKRSRSDFHCHGGERLAVNVPPFVYKIFMSCSVNFTP